MRYKHYNFRVFWSKEDKEWVATLAEMPSLSSLSRTPIGALAGLVSIIEDFEGDHEHELGGEA